MEPIHTAEEHEFVEQGRRGCGPGCQLSVQACSCGLSRRLRIIDGKVRSVEVQVRAAWPWQDVRELLTMNLPYALCPACSGEGCDGCRSLGIMERMPRHSGVAR